MHNFRELKIWQKSRELSVDTYLLTKEFPSNEQFGLTSQVQRAAISISSNIAEGSSRNSEKDFVRFLNIAKGSSFELETQLIIASDLGYIKSKASMNIIDKIRELQNMIHGFIQMLENKS